jgi:tetraacyldisaccharide 4'-kinase
MPPSIGVYSSSVERESAFRRRIAAHLEAGLAVAAPSRLQRAAHVIARASARSWAARVRVDVPLVWRPEHGETVITVGGATLGGGGKTRLALATVAWLAERGVSVCVIGHAYKSHPKVARVVDSKDDVRVVGDEALACVRWLARRSNSARHPVSVVVAPTRQAAVDHAFRELGARVVVVDGVVQTSPKRADLALLAVDADAPWGSSACPPLGDLRAPIDRLRDATDLIVEMPLANGSLEDDLGSSVAAPSVAVGKRVGLITALARPDRIERALATMGIAPVVHVALGDHARPTTKDRAHFHDVAARHWLDAWIATDKCTAALAVTRSFLATTELGAPLLTLVPEIALPAEVQARMSDRLGAALCSERPQPRTSIENERTRCTTAS